MVHGVGNSRHRYSIRYNKSKVESDVSVVKTLSEECSGVAGS